MIFFALIEELQPCTVIPMLPGSNRQHLPKLAINTGCPVISPCEPVKTPFEVCGSEYIKVGGN